MKQVHSVMTWYHQYKSIVSLYVFIVSMIGLMSACGEMDSEEKGDPFIESGEVCSAEKTPNWSLLAAQTVPTPGAKNVSPFAPVIIFVAASFDAGDIGQKQLTVKVDGSSVKGRFKAIKRKTTTVFVFIPKDPWPSNAKVKVTIDYLLDKWSYSFHTGNWDDQTTQTLTGEVELGFETASMASGETCKQTIDNSVYLGFGDVYMGDRDYGFITPTEGNKHLLMSTGEILGGAAIGGTTSYVTSRPIPTNGAKQLTFDQRFVSEEFDEYVGSVYDDGLFLVAWGPDDIAFKESSGVNKIGEDDSDPSIFPALADADAGPESIGQIKNLTRLGSPIVLTWVLTDVSDPQLQSVVAIDNVQLVP